MGNVIVDVVGCCLRVVIILVFVHVDDDVDGDLVVGVGGDVGVEVGDDDGAALGYDVDVDVVGVFVGDVVSSDFVGDVDLVVDKCVSHVGVFLLMLMSMLFLILMLRLMLMVLLMLILMFMLMMLILMLSLMRIWTIRVMLLMWLL